MQNIAAFYKGDHRFELRDAAVLAAAAGEVQIKARGAAFAGRTCMFFMVPWIMRVGSNRIIGHKMFGAVAALSAGTLSPTAMSDTCETA